MWINFIFCVQRKNGKNYKNDYIYNKVIQSLWGIWYSFNHLNLCYFPFKNMKKKKKIFHILELVKSELIYNLRCIESQIVILTKFTMFFINF